MATPADHRLLELLDKWLKSLELHLEYSALDDQRYSTIQPWPKHQRPNRWIVDLAMQKATGLRTAVLERIDKGDTGFADALELMGFLTNLVGSQHIERFIPLAEARTEYPVAEAPGASATGTREMPRFVPNEQHAPPPAGTPRVARTERRDATVKPESPSGGKVYPGPSAAVREQVIADAVRLVQWGRKWYELAELISGMADRPVLSDVRRILQDNKTLIDEKAGRV